MKKRITSALLSAALLLYLSGCTALFKKEYLSVSAYQEGAHSADSGEIRLISDYTALKSAIISLVNEHKTEGRLRFTNYEGTIQQDLSQAIWDVQAQSALASFAADKKIYYDLNSIVTYYEAVIHITYTRTQSEIDAVRYITGRSAFADVFGPMLEELAGYAALRMTSATISAEEISEAVVTAYEKNPAACVVSPQVTVRIHPESGLQRIIEVELEYGWKLTELQKMKSALQERIEKVVSGISGVRPAEIALELFRRLSQNCKYDPDGLMRSSRSELNSGLGSTAYGALVEGYADSKGFAVAYSALCREAGIECLVVSGTRDGEPHSWNIIGIGDGYHHADASAYPLLELDSAFLLSDGQMARNSVWDTGKYPACGESQSFSDIIKKIF
ncbi:MAG: transglutaminase domain-containing protein [Oscillospiraceae bacterium]|jgi:transglutaminase-like putative cysteine protease|nr:transglutaminase domain-containing protein [Oscillospiraceae bacterium]